MSQYQARKKALSQKRDQMMDLFVDSRINLANKPTTYGEFYDYVVDLDRPQPKAKRLSAKAIPQTKPAVPAKVDNTDQVPVLQQTATHPKPVQSDTKAAKKEVPNTGKGGIWDNYTES